MDDWFFIGVIWAQSAMLIYCAYVIHCNVRYLRRVNEGLNDVAKFVGEQERYICQLIDERDALRTSLRLHREER